MATNNIVTCQGEDVSTNLSDPSMGMTNLVQTHNMTVKCLWTNIMTVAMNVRTENWNSQQHLCPHTLFPKGNATLISRFFLVTLDQGQWPQVMWTKGNGVFEEPGAMYKWNLTQSSLAYTPPQKKGNFRKVAFLLGKSVYDPEKRQCQKWQATINDPPHRNKVQSQ